MLHKDLKKYLQNKKGSLLVVGAPGTGKTYQLARLVEYLVVAKKIRPERILVFCFNRRWAKRLREYTAGLISSSFFEIPITTFSAYCTDLVGKIKFMAGKTAPGPKKDSNGINPLIDGELKILNAPEQWKLLKETIISRLDKNIFPMTFKYILNENTSVADSFLQETFDFILRAQENLLAPTDLTRRIKAENRPVLNEIVGIYSIYKKILISKNYYNYGRLLEDTVSFLKKENDITKNIQESYDFIIIDDLQEVNKAQFEIVKEISRNNCIFFGNDDQCTYAFRGSSINIFNEVYEILGSGKNKDKNILFLEKNYRNGALINDISNSFIAKNKFRLNKNSKTTDLVGDSVLIKDFKSTLDEVNFIARKIKYLIIERDIKPENIIILVKGRGYKTRLLENTLDSNSIPFLQRNSRVLLDNPYVRYILNFFKLYVLLKPYFKNKNVENETPPDDKSIIIDKILDSLIVLDFISYKPLPIINKCREQKDVWKKLRAVPLLNEVLIDFLKIKNQTAYEIIMKFLSDKRIGIFNYLSEKEIINENEKSAIIGVLGDFINTVKDFVEKNPEGNKIDDFLFFIEDMLSSSFLQEIEDSTKEFIKKGFINIMSYHQCRGLEFDAVFLPFINKNYLPSGFGSTQLYDMQVFNIFSGGKIIPEELLKKKHFEDERKLFFNGLTRAKKFLFISSSNMEESSIFFDEVKKITKISKSKELNKKNYIKDRDKELIRGTDNSLSKNRAINSREHWLVRKSMVSRTFKFSKSKNINMDKFNKDLIFLAANYPYEKWWRTRGPTKNKNRPYDIAKPVHSYSSLSTFKECPFKYKMKYYFKIDEEENLALVVGRIYHEILKNFFNAGKNQYSWASLKRIIKKTFNLYNYKFDFNYLRNEVFQKAYRDFKRLYDYFISRKDLNVVMEKGFTFNIDDDQVKGRIDQINLLDDNNAELIDFKSGAKNICANDLKDEIQLRIYRMAVDLCVGLDFVKGKDISLKYIFIGDEKSKSPWVVLPKDEYNYKKFKNYLKKIIGKIKKEDFSADPENTYSCLLCGYKIICPNKNV